MSYKESLKKRNEVLTLVEYTIYSIVILLIFVYGGITPAFAIMVGMMVGKMITLLTLAILAFNESIE